MATETELVQIDDDIRPATPAEAAALAAIQDGMQYPDFGAA